MASASNQIFDFLPYWTWFLLAVRTTTLLMFLPGIGTAEIPAQYRMFLSYSLAALIAFGGVRAHAPATVAEGGLMIGVEVLVGYLLALAPIFILQGLAVSGQLISGSIGLSFANIFDPLTEHQVPVLARVQTYIGTAVFMVMDGHHAVIRALAGEGTTLGVGAYRPGELTAELILNRFADIFQLAISFAAPILVAVLVTNFVLGLITKAVPQVNVFIIGMPLTLGMGFYLAGFTLPAIAERVVSEFNEMPETVLKLLQSN